MYNLANIEHNKLQFDGLVSKYENELDPVFDCPLACIENENGFKVVNGHLYLTFNSDQYIYDVLHKFIGGIFTTGLNIPIKISEDKCTIQLYLNYPRIPTYLTTTSKGASKCFLNIEDELKDFLTDGIGFKLQFKIRSLDNQIIFSLDSVQIPDMFDGEQDYIDGNNFNDESSDSDSYIDDSDGYDLDESDEELVDYYIII